MIIFLTNKILNTIKIINKSKISQNKIWVKFKQVNLKKNHPVWMNFSQPKRIKSNVPQTSNKTSTQRKFSQITPSDKNQQNQPFDILVDNTGKIPSIIKPEGVNDSSFLQNSNSLLEGLDDQRSKEQQIDEYKDDDGKNPRLTPRPRIPLLRRSRKRPPRHVENSRAKIRIPTTSHDTLEK